MIFQRFFRIATIILGFIAAAPVLAGDVWEEVEHGYADNNGVKIHYASLGEGPLVIMIHGFPDFWYSWREQMAVLKDDFKVVAMDQRGYNLSGQPEGEENYNMTFLTADVEAVIKHLGAEKAIIVGHDWGGIVSWTFAMTRPQMVDKLVILNLPHPNGLARELASNPQQQENSGYARKFQAGKATDPDIFFGLPMTPQTLSVWVRDQEAKPRYIEAFQQSSFDAMLAYYKQNYGGGDPNVTLPKVQMPVLMFHGLNDTALHSDGLNNTWDWLEKDLTLVTVPSASHFVQQDASDLVATTMKWWLLSRQ
jgi:pimeloyl-ACP methyl ester carboxylesterase